MQTLELLLQPEWVRTLLACVLLLLVAWLTGHIGRLALGRAAHVASACTSWRWDDAMIEHGVPRRLAQVLALLVVRYGLPAIPHLPAAVEAALANIALALFQQPTGADLRAGSAGGGESSVPGEMTAAHSGSL